MVQPGKSQDSSELPEPTGAIRGIAMTEGFLLLDAARLLAARSVSKPQMAEAKKPQKDPNTIAKQNACNQSSFEATRETCLVTFCFILVVLLLVHCLIMFIGCRCLCCVAKILTSLLCSVLLIDRAIERSTDAHMYRYVYIYIYMCISRYRKTDRVT